MPPPPPPRPRARGVSGSDDEQLVAPTSARPPTFLPALGEFDAYEIVGRLAMGGMAEILLAREGVEGAGARYLVVKRILAQYAAERDFADMFLQEAQVLMRLSHPSICHVYRYGVFDETQFIAMEWVNGEQLAKVIRRARQEQGLPIGIAVRIISQVAAALHHAHEANDDNGRPLGLIHRDVTPQNVMVTYDGAVKLLDFGIAKAAIATQQTRAGIVKGKFAYMAPEQARGISIDRRVDVFALGVCLWEVITGRALFGRETEVDTLRAVLEGNIPSVQDARPDASDALDVIIAKATARDPSHRYASAEELHLALEHFLVASSTMVGSSHIASLMRRMFSDEIAQGPRVDTSVFGGARSGVRRATSTPGGSSSGARAAPISRPTEKALTSDPRATATQHGTSGRVSKAPGPQPPRQRVNTAAGLVHVPTGARFSDDSLRPRTSSAGGGVVVEEGLDVDLSNVGPRHSSPRISRDATAQARHRTSTAATGSGGAIPVSTTPRAWYERFSMRDRILMVSGVLVCLGLFVAGRMIVSAKQTAPPESAAPSSAARSRGGPIEAFGYVSIDSQPAAQVSFEGVSLGTTPLRRLRLPANRIIQLELRDSNGRYVRRRVYVHEMQDVPVFVNMKGE